MSSQTAMSRRGVIAALAAGAAVNVPVIAMTAAPPVAAAHPDHGLLDLGRQYDAALGAENAALEHWTSACDTYDAARPAMPDVLRHRMDDHFTHRFPILGSTRQITDNEHSDFYNVDEVDVVRAMRDFRDAEGQARANAIVAAWDGHRAACEALPAYGRCLGAEAAYYAAVRVRQALGDAIAAERATTLAGLAVRSRIVAGLRGVDDRDEGQGADYEALTFEEKMIAAILRDLTAMVLPS